MKTKDAVAVVARALRKADKPNLADVIEEALTPKPPKTALDLLREHQEIFASRPRFPFGGIHPRETYREYAMKMHSWRVESRALIQADDHRSCTHKRAVYSRSCLCGKRTF